VSPCHSFSIIHQSGENSPSRGQNSVSPECVAVKSRPLSTLRGARVGGRKALPALLRSAPRERGKGKTAPSGPIFHFSLAEKSGNAFPSRPSRPYRRETPSSRANRAQSAHAELPNSPSLPRGVFRLSILAHATTPFPQRWAHPSVLFPPKNPVCSSGSRLLLVRAHLAEELRLWQCFPWCTFSRWNEISASLGATLS